MGDDDGHEARREAERQEHFGGGAEDPHLRAAFVLRTEAPHEGHGQVGIRGSQLFVNALRDRIARPRCGRARVDEHARGIGGPDLAYRADRPLRAQLMELVEQKLRLLDDPHFVDLARVAIAAGLHSPTLARDMLERLGDREEGITTWVRAAAADGRLKTDDPLFAAMQLQALVKGPAFWPQMSMGQPALDAAQQRQVADGAVDMVLARYG